MLRYGKESTPEKMNAEKFNRERLMEKAIGKFIRKLEMMVDSKLPKEHLISSAASYGLEVTDYSKKIADYLNISRESATAPAPSEPASKAPKAAQKKSETKKEVKTEEAVEPQQASSSEAK